MRIACPNKSGVLYKELLKLNNNDEDLTTYAHDLITELQDLGLMSLKRYKKPNGEFVYTIPKTITEKSLAENVKGKDTIYEIDKAKYNQLKDIVNKQNISFINPVISKSGDAIFVNITSVKNNKIDRLDFFLGDEALYEQELAEDRELTINRIQEEIKNKPGVQLSLFGVDSSKSKNLEFDIKTLNTIDEFLKSIGVEQRLVSKILNEKGNVIDSAIAAANFIQGTIDIAEQTRIDVLENSNLSDEEKTAKIVDFWKKVDSKLPEEAAHFWYRLLKHSSPLKKSLWEAAKNSDKLKELAGSNYGNYNSLDAFTEEAIGQLIAESIYRIQNNKATEADKNFWNKFINWIKKLFIEVKQHINTPFDEAAKKILNKDIKDLYDLEYYSNVVNRLTDNELDKIVNDVHNNDIIYDSKNKNIIYQYNNLAYTVNFYMNDSYKQLDLSFSFQFDTQNPYTNFIQTVVPDIWRYQNSGFSKKDINNISSDKELTEYLIDALEYFNLNEYEVVKKNIQKSISKSYSDITDINILKQIFNRLFSDGAFDELFQKYKNKSINKGGFIVEFKKITNNYININNSQIDINLLDKELNLKSTRVFNKGHFQKIELPRILNALVYNKLNDIKTNKYLLVKNFRENSKDLSTDTIKTIFKLNELIDRKLKNKPIDINKFKEKALKKIYDIIINDFNNLGYSDYIITSNLDNSVGFKINDLLFDDFKLLENIKYDSKNKSIRFWAEIPERFSQIYGDSFFVKLLIDNLKKDNIYNDIMNPVKGYYDKIKFSKYSFHNLNIKNINSDEFKEILFFNGLLLSSDLKQNLSDIVKEKTGKSLSIYFSNILNNTLNTEYLNSEKKIINKKLGVNKLYSEEYFKSFDKIDRFFIANKISEILEASNKKVITELAVINLMNQINYDPNEAYERGFGFYHGFPGYSDQIETNEITFNDVKNFVDGVLWSTDRELHFPLSTYTAQSKFKNEKWNHKLGSRRQQVRIVLFPESSDIKLAGKDDIYSGQRDNVRLEELNLKLPVTKYYFKDIDSITSTIADSIELRDHNHNEQVIDLKKGRFYFEYDNDISDEIKNYLNTVNQKLLNNLKVNPNIINENSDYIDNSPYVVKKTNKSLIDIKKSNEINKKFTKGPLINISKLYKDIKKELTEDKIIEYKLQKKENLTNYLEAYIKDFKEFNQVLNQYTDYKQDKENLLYNNDIIEVIDFYLNSGEAATFTNFQSHVNTNKINYLFGIDQLATQPTQTTDNFNQEDTQIINNLINEGEIKTKCN